MLVVGKGGSAGGRRDSDSYGYAYYSGGGSGMVAYKKNILTESYPTLLSINFNDTTFTDAIASTKVSFNSNTYIIAAGGFKDANNSINGATSVSYYVNGVDRTSTLNGYGSSGGGAGGAGGGGSAGRGLNCNGLSQMGAGGIGGTGIYGWPGGSLNGNISLTGGTGVKLGGVIPITTIFHGTGTGGNGSLDTNAKIVGGGGGAGYGNGGSNSSGGYGSGGGSGTSGLTPVGGNGIVCLYYHNDPIE